MSPGPGSPPSRAAPRRRLLLLVLGVGLSLQLAGAAWQATLRGSQVLPGTLLPTLLLAAGALAAIPGALGRGPLPQAILLLVGALVGGEVLVDALSSAGPAGALHPAARAVRYLVPIALGLHGLRRLSHAQVVGVAQIAVAAVFLAHGVEALLEDPSFVAYLVHVPRVVFGVGPDVGLAKLLLVPIGVVDIVLALALLVHPTRGGLAYMAFWGLLTASIRTIHYGPDGAHESLVRALNGLAPLALVLGEGAPRSFLRWKVRVSSALARSAARSR